MFYPNGVDKFPYIKLKSLAAYYLWECWPEKDWFLVCCIVGQAIEDITCDRPVVRRGYLKKEFTFWETYDWLVEFLPLVTKKAGADPQTVRELLLFEYTDEFILDFMPDITGESSAIPELPEQPTNVDQTDSHA